MLEVRHQVPALSQELIKRANEAGTVVDYGDSTSRMYDANVKEIQSMDLTDNEKASAIQELHRLTESQLQAEGQARSPYSMGVGPARFNAKQMQKNSTNAVNARQTVENHMNTLRNTQKAKQKENENRARLTAMQNVIKNGDLKFTVNGETWIRKSKRGKTFTKA